MEDKTNKPLRTSANKVKDLYDVYIKSNKKPRGFATEQTTEEQSKQNDIEHKNERIVEVQDTHEHQDELTEDQMAQLAEKFEELEKERDDLRDQVKRLAADMENLRRRSLKEKQEMIDYANERLLFKILPVIDDFEAAIEATKKASDSESLLQGIDLIYQKFLKTLEEAGVTPMNSPAGEVFNVDFHDALMQMPSDLEEGKVVQEVQKGYFLNGKVLRHAKVITSSGNAE